MSKKTFFISMLAMCVALVWIVEASALTCSRCRRSPWGLCLEEVLKALGNTQKNVTFSIMDINVERLTIESWCNHGDECNGDPGNPFEFSTEQSLITQEQVTDQVDKNGKTLVDQYVPGCYLWDFIWCAGELDYGTATEPVCVQYACLQEDDQGKCLVWDYTQCLYYGGVCPAATGYDYSAIPPEGFPANGNTNWSPEPPYCDPNTQPLGSLDHDGNVVVNKMLVTSQKTVWACPKGVTYPDAGCVEDTTTVDEACLVLNADYVSYDKVSLSECTSYDTAN